MKKSLQPLLAALIVPTLSVGGVFAVAKTFGSKSNYVSVPAGDAEASPVKASVSAGPEPAMGRNLFVQSCARCHGNDARGNGEDDDGPNLYALRISDARIQSVILKGVRGEMPSFAKKFSPADTAALISYLRSLKDK